MRCLLFIYLILFIFTHFIVCENKQNRNFFVQRDMRAAIDQGLKFVATQQNPDGSFGISNKFRIAVTSFAALALMSDGNLPGRGRYGSHVKKALLFLLENFNPSGYISRQGDSSRMHGQGFATLALAQAYGMSTSSSLSRRIRKNLKRAVKLIINSQTIDGGWGYYPFSKFHEGSITVCQLQALRACRNVGIHVPKKVIHKAIEYLKRSANPDGTFKYRLGMTQNRKSFPLAAAGVSSLNAAGEYDTKEARMGIKFMKKYLPGTIGIRGLHRSFYYYAHFYAIQAMYHSSIEDWREWFPAIRSELLKNQEPGGTWGGRQKGVYSKYGKIYATSIATLILQVPYNYLPIFQK